MGFFDFLWPRTNADPRRIDAPRRRQKAVERLTDFTLLMEIARSDSVDEIRRLAAYRALFCSGAWTMQDHINGKEAADLLGACADAAMLNKLLAMASVRANTGQRTSPQTADEVKQEGLMQYESGAAIQALAAFRRARNDREQNDVVLQEVENILLGALTNGNSNQQLAAAISLCDQALPSAFIPLTLALANNSGREWVARALGHLGDPRAVEHLPVLFMDDNKAIREAAAEALKVIKQKTGAEPRPTLLRVETFKSAEQVAELIASGANVNERDNRGRTPLHLFIRFGSDVTRDKVQELLLSHGADANARDRDGETPLFVVVSPTYNQFGSYTRSGLLQRLLEHGADPHVSDNKGESVMQRFERHKSSWGQEGETMEESLLQAINKPTT